MSILSSIKNYVANTSVGKLASGIGTSYIDTTQGSDYIASKTTSDAQKRFQTKAAIPNLPKPKTFFFTYYSLNKDVASMISKKREMIKYIANHTSTGSSSSSNSDRQNVETSLKSKANSMFSSAVNSISSAMSSLTGSKATTSVMDSNNQSMTGIDYIPDSTILNQLGFELSKFTRSIAKPNIKFETSEHNEYNRKRLTYKKMNYGDVTVSFYNVKENPVQQFFFSYLKMINQNFLCKSPSNWKEQIKNNKWDNDRSLNDWGFDLDSNFRLIDRISVCEFYMNRIMVYTYENPIITNIEFGDNELGNFESSDIKVTFQIEGMTNDLLDLSPYNVQLIESNNNIYLKNMVNGKINEDLATFLNMRYQDGTDYAISSAASFVKGLFSLSDGDSTGTKIKNQLLDTGRKLGFAEEITLGNKIVDTVDNYKDSDDKGEYIFNVVDDPTSVVGMTTGADSGRISNNTKNLVNLF